MKFLKSFFVVSVVALAGFALEAQAQTTYNSAYPYVYWNTPSQYAQVTPPIYNSYGTSYDPYGYIPYGNVAPFTNPAAYYPPTYNASVSPVPTGVMPQRLGWQTYTNREWSYALSYPMGWQVLGGGQIALITDGRAAVSVQAVPVSAGTTATQFANMYGIYSGFVTTKVNAYTALQTTEGANTAYYITNGAVAYKILVTNNITAAEAGVIRNMLIEFTVTRQR